MGRCMTRINVRRLKGLMQWGAQPHPLRFRATANQPGWRGDGAHSSPGAACDVPVPRPDRTYGPAPEPTVGGRICLYT